MISIATYLIGLVILIALFVVGLYAVYKDNVLGFVASGFSAITSIVFTVLAGFGKVGNVENVPVYSYNYSLVEGVGATGTGTTAISPITTYIDSSIVYLNGFISIMMIVILLFIIGRYIATLTIMRKESEEE